MSHHKYSPSALANLEKCPSYKNKENGDSDAAIRGTRIHKAVEETRPEMLADEAERELAMQCILARQKLLAAHPGAEVHEEFRLVCDLFHGTGDLVLLDFALREAVVADYKTGAVGVQPPSRNLQLWAYAYAVFQMYPEIESATMAVIQPKVSGETQTAPVGRAFCGECKARVERIVEAVERGGEYYPGDVCEYCGNKADCPALIRLGEAVAREVSGLPAPASYLPGVPRDPEQIARLQSAAAILSDWADQVKKECAAVTKDAQLQVPGYKLVSRKGNRKVANPVSLAIAANELGVSLDTLYAGCCTVSAKKAAELVYDLTGNDAERFLADMEEAGVVERGEDVVYLQKSRGSDPVKILKESD